MSSFCWIYGSKDELAEAYSSYMPQNKRDKLNTMARNSANSAVIDEDSIYKDEDGVDEYDFLLYPRKLKMKMTERGKTRLLQIAAMPLHCSK